MGLYLLIMGVQGAGKGEQSKFIQETYGIPQVSTGDLFRAMKTRTDPLALRVQSIMATGKLVDDDTTNEVAVDRLAQPDAAKGVILDGYPRTIPQAEFLARYLAAKGEKLAAVLVMELDLFVAFKRAFGRVTHKPTNTSYNYYFRTEGVAFNFAAHPEHTYPPRMVATLQATGEELERRPDDADAAAIIKRIDVYLDTTRPLIAYYEQHGLVHRVNADQSIAAVSAEITRIISAVHG